MSNKAPASTASSLVRKAYSLDLAGHIQACEMNYHRLLALLPGVRDGADQWRYKLGDQSRIDIQIRLKESTPYTSVVEVLQQRPGLSLPSIVLRLYHDVDVAEVIAFSGHRQWQAKYEYPNPEMYQPDEKASLNKFLAEWLVFCRRHGAVSAVNCESVRVIRK